MYEEILEYMDCIPDCEKAELTDFQFNKMEEEFKNIHPEFSFSYGITAEDILRMCNDPKEFVSYAIFLSTRPYYNGDANYQFTNQDALSKEDAIRLINAFLLKCVNWSYPDEEEPEKKKRGPKPKNKAH